MDFAEPTFHTPCCGRVSRTRSSRWGVWCPATTPCGWKKRSGPVARSTRARRGGLVVKNSLASELRLSSLLFARGLLFCILVPIALLELLQPGQGFDNGLGGEGGDPGTPPVGGQGEANRGQILGDFEVELAHEGGDGLEDALGPDERLPDAVGR